MTVIVAVSDGSKVCMASDSQTSQKNGSKDLLVGPKMIQVANWLFGISGPQAINDFLHYAPVLADVTPGINFRWYLSQMVVPALRIFLNENSLMEEHDAYKIMPCTIIAARGGEFAEIDNRGGVVQFARKWHAIGSGGAEARGALLVMEHVIEGPEARASRAVSAACSLDDGCSEPVHVTWTT